MKRLPIYALALTVGILVVQPVRADDESFVFIDCATQSPHPDPEIDLHLELQHLGSQEAAHRSDLKRGGYHPADAMAYSCKLGKSTYRIKTVTGPPRAAAICGAAPPTILWLYRDDRLIVDSVIFGENCWMQPAITTLTLFRKGSTAHGQPIRLCYMTDGRIQKPYIAKPGCVSLSRDEWNRSLPYTQKALEKAVERWAPSLGL